MTFDGALFISPLVSQSLYCVKVQSRQVSDWDVTEQANIRIHRMGMQILCAKSVGCGCGFVARLKLPAIIATLIRLCYLKLSTFQTNQQ